jgi:DNA-binding protein Fis
MSAKLTVEQIRVVQEALRAMAKHKSQNKAAVALGITRSGLRSRLQTAATAKIALDTEPEVHFSRGKMADDEGRRMHETLRAMEMHNQNQNKAALALGIARSTLQNRLRVAEMKSNQVIAPAPNVPALQTENELRDQLRKLQTEMKFSEGARLDDEYVKRKIIGLRDSMASHEVPDWLARPIKTYNGTGVPTLFASDWHWGEVVDPKQIGGVNKYSVAIAQERLRTMIEVTLDLLFNHLKLPDYPGIVFALGGDMFSGDIHEELTATNESEIMPLIVDIWGHLVRAIEVLADRFGAVFVPCVTGNHGRNTQKIRAKGRAYTNFDWLLYQFLAKRFEGDDRVRFAIPSGPDLLFSVMGHRYLLTHGDQFRGGDGMIGALGPIIRGDHKKRSRNAQIDMGYDTMMIGHWHQLIQLQRLIVNGSGVGYNEYAFNNNFGFEPAQQALWITHPDHGITFSMKVHLDRVKTKTKAGPWVGWQT